MARITLDRFRAIAGIVAGKEVLDVGCVDLELPESQRKHWLHDHLRGAASHVVGLDSDREHVGRLRRQGYDVVCGDACSFDLDRQFDIVVAGELLEHLSRPAAFLASARRHLRPDGLLVLSTPNANCLAYFIENVLWGRELDNPDHVCLYTPTSLRTFLEQCGFRVIRTVFVAHNTAYYHHSVAKKAAVHLKQLAQVLLGMIRPSLVQQFITVAAPV